MRRQTFKLGRLTYLRNNDEMIKIYAKILSATKSSCRLGVCVEVKYYIRERLDLFPCLHSLNLFSFILSPKTISSFLFSVLACILQTLRPKTAVSHRKRQRSVPICKRCKDMQADAIRCAKSNDLEKIAGRFIDN